MPWWRKYTQRAWPPDNFFMTLLVFSELGFMCGENKWVFHRLSHVFIVSSSAQRAAHSLTCLFVFLWRPQDGFCMLLAINVVCLASAYHEGRSSERPGIGWGMIHSTREFASYRIWASTGDQIQTARVSSMLISATSTLEQWGK